MNIKSLIHGLANNVAVNPIMILLGADEKLRKKWTRAVINPKKSLQENMGFSHYAPVEANLRMCHEEVQRVYRTHCNGGAVLDIGCGAGLYLKDFDAATEVAGVDLSADFLAKAREVVPRGAYHEGDYLKTAFGRKFRFIYSISTIQYVCPSRLSRFVDKLAGDLEDGGMVLLQYPPALSLWDCLYPDLSYILYSPKVLEKKFSRRFDIVSHRHHDGRTLHSRYDSVRRDPDWHRSFRNGAILVARKRG